jgi:hypothetical protein
MGPRRAAPARARVLILGEELIGESFQVRLRQSCAFELHGRDRVNTGPEIDKRRSGKRGDEDQRRCLHQALLAPEESRMIAQPNEQQKAEEQCHKERQSPEER